MPAFSCRGDDGIERTVELELGVCDICHKAVLADLAPPLPAPFNERQWPAVREQLERLGLLPENVSGPRFNLDDWGR